jgi:hypothetical protein
MSDTERPTSVALRNGSSEMRQSYSAQFTTGQIKNALRLDIAHMDSGTRKRSRSGTVCTDFQQKVVPAERRLIDAAQAG